MTNADEVIDKLRAWLDLPADTTPEQVLAAAETSAIRRAAAVGLPTNATFQQIQVAESAVAAAVAAAERKVAAAAAVGHSVSSDSESWHPALRPSEGRVPQNGSKSIDYSAILAEGNL
ncbi:hypothetical protein [Pseudosporangium ferrugineum]|uniref:Uncharacterized protein n=1 Tax=Pseudosporangium ferrugineum TaxID=439699 RepID=A0A2T0RSI6_9ACTN|nr:hypothetical protein [Pseudosporangium ferrugineum]PRY24053.1 hypothetical protein CLV70_114186 [Pseudosporangium ferrugineum]